jgi:hypothetical protein
MNPSSNNGGMELPQPVSIESGPAAKLSGGEKPATNQEQQVSKESAPSPSSGAPALPPASIPLNTVPSQQPPAAQGATDDKTQIPGKSLISDKDLIEREWVDKAKAIVNKTRDDPFQQSEELTVLKADYMKKEFNKSIKLDK